MRIKKWGPFGAMVAVFVLSQCVYACKRRSANAQLATTVSKATDDQSTKLAGDVRLIFEKNCVSCHKTDGDGDFNILNFANLRNASDAQFLDLSSPEDSNLLQRIESGEMPPDDRKKLSQAESALVESWIAAGAPDAANTPQVSLQDPKVKAAVAGVGQLYNASVRETLEKKCADCHSSAVAVPTQGYIPFVGVVVLADIEKGQEKLNFANGFPFAGANSLPKMIGDLEMLKGTIKANTMPPTKYVVAHPFSSLSKQEKELIAKWCEVSIQRLDEALTAASRAP